MAARAAAPAVALAMGRVVLGSQTTEHSSSTNLAGTVSIPIGPILNKWAWSLAPQAS